MNSPLPFKNGITDCIIITEVLEHLRNPSFTLSEIHRVLKHRGKLFLTVPSFFRPHEIPNDFCRFTFFGLKYLLQKGGFKNFQIKGHGDEFTILAESLMFALRRTHLPKKVLLFLIAFINTIFYLRERKKFPEVSPERNTIGLSAIAVK